MCNKTIRLLIFISNEFKNMKIVILYGFIQTFILGNQNNIISNAYSYIIFIFRHLHLHLYLIGQQVCFLYTAVQPGIVK